MKTVFFFSITISMLSIVFGSGPCEKIESYDWAYLESGPLNTCFMTENTVIDSTGFLITSPKDESVEALTVWGNEKVQYLPENSDETLPNLKVFVARYCLIGAISKRNFAKLSKLVKLDLDHNQIERIDSDTFEDLTSLEHLAISVNQIKYVNSRAFAVLPNLKKFWIQINPCISEGTKTPSLIAGILQNVDKKCGFCELSKPYDIAICEMTKQISDLQAFSARSSVDLMAQLLEKTREVTDLSNNGTALKFENIAIEAKAERLERDLKDEKARNVEQINSIKELSAKSENLMKKNFDLMLEAKLQEISSLSTELQAKSAEVIEKNEEIKMFKKKNEILNGQREW